jgi:hypothetical protein
MKNQNSAFYVKAKIMWKDSSRRKGGYFSYSDISFSNCLIEVKGNTAFIYTKSSVYEKRINGKYFSFTGKQVTEKTFNKHLKERKTFNDSLEEERRVKAEQEKQAIKKRLSEVKELIVNFINLNHPDWTKNEGNSHTRRTRWANRCARIIGSRDFGSLTRDTFFEIMGKNPEFFVNGKYNPEHA